jgi:DNA-directed RNA polymerase subunit E'/Rpb7
VSTNKENPMEAKEIVIEGRKYMAYVSPDEQNGAFVIIGPPEGLVDTLHIPEPFATTLHNILFDRKLFTYKDIAANQKVAVGVIQEAMGLDAQKLVEAYFQFGTETGGSK